MCVCVCVCVCVCACVCEGVRGEKYNLRKFHIAMHKSVSFTPWADLCFASCRFSQVVFVTSNKITSPFLFPMVFGINHLSTDFSAYKIVTMASGGPTRFVKTLKQCHVYKLDSLPRQSQSFQLDKHEDKGEAVKRITIEEKKKHQPCKALQAQAKGKETGTQRCAQEQRRDREERQKKDEKTQDLSVRTHKHGLRTKTEKSPKLQCYHHQRHTVWTTSHCATYGKKRIW